MDSQKSGGSKDKEGVVEGKEDGAVRVSEKELPALPEGAGKGGVMSSYYDDASDEEEAREVGVARTTSKRVESRGAKS